MDETLPSGIRGIRTRAPAWLVVSTALALFATVASLLLALELDAGISARVSEIERSFTVAGWRNEAAVAEAVSSDEGLGRLRDLRMAAFAGVGLLAAAAALLTVLVVRDRRRRAGLLEQAVAGMKAEKADAVRGFISQHIDTLAQKRSELRVANAYGVVDDGAWHQELVYFVNRVLRPSCRVDADVYSFVELRAMIEKQISLLG